MKKVYVDTPSGQIHYVTEGDGSAVVLLHQAPLSSDEYKEMIPMIGSRFRVLSMDIPGYGQSDTPNRYYTVAEYAACVIHFLDALNIEQASIVGTHTGAAIGIEAAVTWPERIQKIIMNGCPFYTPDVRKARLKDTRYDPMPVMEDASHLLKIWEIPKYWSPKSDPLIWHRWLVDYLRSGERDAHQALFRYEIEKRLPLIKIPCLLIYGTESIFYQRMEATQELIPECETKVIDGGGFFLGYERPVEFSQAILEFL